jgi:hypothetical protein
MTFKNITTIAKRIILGTACVIKLLADKINKNPALKNTSE